MPRRLSLALAAASALGAPVEPARPDCEHVADYKLPGVKASGGTSVMCVHPPGETISDAIRSTGMWDGELCKLIMHAGRRHGEAADHDGSSTSAPISAPVPLRIQCRTACRLCRAGALELQDARWHTRCTSLASTASAPHRLASVECGNELQRGRHHVPTWQRK